MHKGHTIVTDGPGSVPEQAPVVQVDVARPPHLADPVDEDIEEDVAIQMVHKEKDFVSLLSCTAGELIKNKLELFELGLANEHPSLINNF